MNTEKIMEDIQSVQDNIREIKSTWGNTIMTLDNIKSGLKADVQKKVDEAYKRGYNDAKQNAGEEYQRGYCEGYKKCLSENDFDQPCVSCNDYQAGMDKAWEIARRIRLNCEDGGIDGDGLRKMFGTANTYTIIKDNTASEAIAKLKAYDDKPSDRIEVGDEVQAPRGKAIITAVKDDFVHYFYSDGDIGCIEPYYVTKTGKHYDIASILEAMRK